MTATLDQPITAPAESEPLVPQRCPAYADVMFDTLTTLRFSCGSVAGHLGDHTASERRGATSALAFGSAHALVTALVIAIWPSE